jgi:hypothetical protein
MEYYKKHQQLMKDGIEAGAAFFSDYLQKLEFATRFS